MLTERTLSDAKETAAELRRRGETRSAEVIETLLAEVQEERLHPLDVVTSTQAGDILGVTGQTIKNWVRDGKLTGYRIGGRIMIPRQSLAAYAALAGASLDLEEVSDEEAAALVAEDRQQR